LARCPPNSVTGVNGWYPDGTGPGRLPGPTDTIRVNWGNNTVTLTNVAPNVSGFQLGLDESGHLVVQGGGSLTAVGSSADRVGNNPNAGVIGRLTVCTNGVVNSAAVMEVGASATGILTIDGGSCNFSNHLWVGGGAVGVSSGTMFLTNGGVLNMLGVGGNGMIGLGTINASSASGGIGTIKVSNGSTLNLFNIDASGKFIWPGSVLDVSRSGVVTIPGNRVAVMGNYTNAGRITACGGLGTVGIDYNNTNVGKTTIYAIAPVAPPRQSITGATASGGKVTLTYQTTAELLYHIESTPSLSPALWTTVAGTITNATGASVTFTLPTSGDQTFYRTVSP
jgi:hypothetical protein